MRCANILIAIPALLALTVMPAHAQLVITPTYTSAITSDPNSVAIESTINSAISMYETTYTNAVNVSITFDENTSGLGQSETYIDDVPYSDYVSHLNATKPGSSLLTYVPSGTDPVNGNPYVQASLPDLRAIGYNPFDESPPPGVTDSTITINTGLTNITRTGTQNPSHYDLQAVAEHEIDEVLGLTSTLDGLSNGNPIPTDVIGPMDLYRFSANGTRSFTTSSSATSYFSVDNGATKIVGFNQTGGGADYHDWVTSGTHRVQDAFGTPGAQPNFGTAEDTALQAVGYNKAAVLAPEPSPVAALGIGILGIGLLIGKARRRALPK